MELVTGEWLPRFGGLADLIRNRVEDGTDLGCGVTVIAHGEVLVDIRAGYADRKKTTAFDDPLLCVYSAGKAVLSALVMRAVSDGHLDYDQRIAEWWPAFGANGKDQLTLGQVLSHQAGLPGFVEETDPAIWLDWEATCARLAEMAPLWPPGTAHGYHPQTVGYLGGEILRRATGETVGQQLISLGVDVHCGMAPEQQARAGFMQKPSAAPDLGPLDELKRAAFLLPWSSAARVSRDAWMAAEIPASNMHATSRGLAEVMQAFATGMLHGRPFASTDAREAAMAERVSGPDRVLPFDLAWAAGLMRNRGGHLGPSADAVGHYGFGGSFVVADPGEGLSIAYVPNKMEPILVGGPRATNLLDEIYRVL
ncbi:MAG: serine hydrolase domain-containing protein [Pseudomonadota bacterium]